VLERYGQLVADERGACRRCGNAPGASPGFSS